MSKRSLLVLLSLVVVPACGGDGGGGGSAPPPVTTLLQDDFSSGNLSNWTVQGGNVSVIPGGNPGPSMAMDGSVTSAGARTNANFSLVSPFTFDFTIDAGHSATVPQNGTISIINNAAPAPISTYVSFTLTAATFAIGGVATTISLTTGGGSLTWRRFNFHVDTASGTASWSLDGVVQLSAPYTVLSVHLLLGEQGGGLTVYDNVLVSFST